MQIEDNLLVQDDEFYVHEYEIRKKLYITPYSKIAIFRKHT